MINEKYIVSPSKKHFKTFCDVIAFVSSIRNNFIYLHVNSFGMNFRTIHDKFDEYYHVLADDLDEILEMTATISDDKFIIPNLNDLKSRSRISDDELESPESMIECARDLVYDVLSIYDVFRETLEEIGNDALISKLDEIANFWVKEYSYVLKRFLI